MMETEGMLAGLRAMLQLSDHIYAVLESDLTCREIADSCDFTEEEIYVMRESDYVPMMDKQVGALISLAALSDTPLG